MARASRVAFAVMEKDAAREGFYRTHDPSRNRQRWATKCDTCGTERIWNIGDNSPIEYMQRTLTKSGWQAHKGTCTCPTCVNEAKMTKQTSTPQPSQAAIETSMKLQRKVYALLDEHFDEEKRIYRDGWSDKKIADAVQTATVYVETVRRSAYGELAEDPATTALRKDIASLEQQVSDLQDTVLNKAVELEQKVNELKARTHNLSVRR